MKREFRNPAGKIHLLYDAFVFAENHGAKNASRSGVFWVAYNILKALSDTGLYRISLYLRENGKHFFKDLRHDRMLKKFPIVIENHLKYEALSKYQIYFSPSVSATPEIITAPGIARFCIVYDAMPLIFPQYYPEYDKNWYASLLHAIDFDTYVFFISRCTKADVLKYIPGKYDPQKMIVSYISTSMNLMPLYDRKKLGPLLRNTPLHIESPDCPGYILSFCTLEPRKNVLFSIRCFLRFIQKHRIGNLYFIVAGAPWKSYEQEVESFFAGLTDVERSRIVRLGYVEDKYVNLLYSNALFFVYPSRYEGFGMPPLEAMRAGTPVITSDNSSLPEVVGDAAVTINCDDEEACIAAFEKLYFDEEARKEYVRRGLERAKLFSWEKAAQKISDTFQNVVVQRDRKMKETRKIKLVYDATELARCQRIQNDRRGIYFCVLNMLQALERTDLFDISLLINQDGAEGFKSFEKEGHLRRFKTIQVRITTAGLYLRNIERHKSALRSTGHPTKKIILLLKILKNQIRLMLCGGMRMNILRKFLRTQDAYFSPMNRIPKTAYDARIKCFVVLYDAIPLVFDEYRSFLEEGTWSGDLFASLNRDTYCLCVSRSTRNDFIRLLPNVLDENKMHVVPIALPHVVMGEYIRARRENNPLARVLKPAYIFSLSANEPRKNFLFSIVVFLKFITRHHIDNLDFYIGGNQVKTLESYLDILDAVDLVENRFIRNWRSRIKLLNYVDETGIDSLYSGALFFVFLSKYEGFGLPPLEAMSAGTPVVCSNNSSLPEVVRDAALTVDCDDEEACIAAFETMCFNKEARGCYIQKGIERAKLFSWEKTAGQIAEIIKETLESEIPKGR